ncbi:MAG: hypothetical protein WBN89_08900 [Prochlorococcaceae cyanobacterium]
MRANKADVEVVRIFQNGCAQRLRFAYDPGGDVSMTADPSLVDGNTGSVNLSRYALSIHAIGAVSQPLSGLVNVPTQNHLLDD